MISMSYMMCSAGKAVLFNDIKGLGVGVGGRGRIDEEVKAV